MSWEVHLADVIDAPQLVTEPPAAIICDPPYGLGLAEWDQDVPDVEAWEALLSIVEPGTPLVAFGARRTSHRLATRIEEAGWEIDDQLVWLYGQGRPAGKAKVKPAHEPAVVAVAPGEPLRVDVEAARIPYEKGYKHRQLNSMCGSGKVFGGQRRYPFKTNPGGRWPATVTHDGEALVGAQANYFYCAKHRKAPYLTPKPVALMRWIVRLLGAQGKPVLDPFCGGGQHRRGGSARGRSLHRPGFQRGGGEAVARAAVCPLPRNAPVGL